MSADTAAYVLTAIAAWVLLSVFVGLVLGRIFGAGRGEDD